MASAAAGSVVSGFEALTIGGSVTVDLDNFGNNTFATVNFEDDTVTLNSVRSETINLTDALGGDLDIVLEDATGTADSLTVNMTSAGALDSTAEVTAAGVETINLVMVDSDTTDHQNTVDLEVAAATTINVSGDAGLIITDTSAGSVDIDLVTTMDASGVVLSAATANGVTYTQAYNVVGGATNITGSNGVDSLTGGSNTDDTVSGGAGVDTLVYTGGTDSFTGGAGNDVHDVNAAGADAGALTITDIADGDTIDLVDASSGGAIANVTATNWDAADITGTLGASATLANYLDAAADQDGSSNGVLEWFQFGGNTYIVLSNDDGTGGGSAGFTAGTDAAILLTGTHDISDSSVTSEVITIA